jgi:hypothetical protein
MSSETKGRACHVYLCRRSKDITVMCHYQPMGYTTLRKNDRPGLEHVDEGAGDEA